MQKNFNDLTDLYTISERIFSNETVIGKRFPQLTLDKVTFSNCRFENIAFSNTSTEINFQNCELQSITFRKTNLTDLTFQDCKLINCNFDKAEMICFRFINCQLYDSSFIGSDMSEGEFYKTKLSKIYFNLSFADDLTIRDSILEEVTCPGMQTIIEKYNKNGSLERDLVNISDYDTFLKLFVRSSQEDQEALNFTMIFFIIIIISFYSFLKLI